MNILASTQKLDPFEIINETHKQKITQKSFGEEFKGGPSSKATQNKRQIFLFLDFFLIFIIYLEFMGL